LIGKVRNSLSANDKFKVGGIMHKLEVSFAPNKNYWNKNFAQDASRGED